MEILKNAAFFPLNISTIYAYGTNTRKGEKKHIKDVLNLSKSLKF